jgi:hypothetical protein
MCRARKLQPPLLARIVSRTLLTARLMSASDLLHLPEMVGRTGGYLPSCWSLERKHKCIKRHANQLANLSRDWESSVLREVTLSHLDRLAQGEPRAWMGPGLRHATPAPHGLQQLLQDLFENGEDVWHVAQDAFGQRNIVSCGDMVRYVATGRNVASVGAVFALVRSSVGTLAILEKWALCRRQPKGLVDRIFEMWEPGPTDQPAYAIAPIGNVVGACTWRQDQHRRIVLEHW